MNSKRGRNGWEKFFACTDDTIIKYANVVDSCGYYICCNSCRKDIKLNHQYYPQHFIEHVKQVHIKETETKANSNIRQFFSKKSKSEGIKSVSSVSSLSKFSSHNLFPCGGILELSMHGDRINLYEEYAKIDEKASYAMIRRQYGRPDAEWQVYARDCEKTKASVINANTRRCSSCCGFVLCALGLLCLAVWCDRLFLSICASSFKRHCVGCQFFYLTTKFANCRHIITVISYFTLSDERRACLTAGDPGPFVPSR